MIWIVMVMVTVTDTVTFIVIFIIVLVVGVLRKMKRMKDVHCGTKFVIVIDIGICFRAAVWNAIMSVTDLLMQIMTICFNM